MKPFVIIKSDIIFAIFQFSVACYERVSLRAGQYTKAHSQANGIILVKYKTILHPMLFSFLKCVHPGNCNDGF